MRVPVYMAAVSALVLSSCSTGSGSLFRSLDTRQNAGPCPTAGALYEASRIVKFVEGTDVDSFGYRDITFTGEVTGVRLFCRYVEDDPLLAEIEIDFSFGKGDAATADSHQYEYFIAITRRNSRILAKEAFVVDADFRKARIDETTELVNRITIPRADETISGANFEVLVGFVLNEDEAAFNRQGQRFRLDAGSN